MRRLTLLLSLLVFAASLSAQPLRLEHNLQLGLGTYVYGGDYHALFQSGHLAHRISYGLDIYGSDRWSVMPEIGGKIYWEGILAIGANGADFDGFTYLDFTVSGRYHLEDGTVLGLGPMLSYTWTPDRYHPNYDPMASISGKAKNKPFNLSIRPSMTFASKGHWHLGVEAEIGLLNVMVQYPEYDQTGNRHLHAIRFFATRVF